MTILPDEVASVANLTSEQDRHDTGLVVGVDGGSTKTIALVADRGGCVLGVGAGGPSNWEVVGEARAAEVIADCIDHALRACGATREDLGFAHLGLSGLDWPEDEPRLRALLTPLLPGVPLAFENDAYLGIRACAPLGHGITVSAGSGVCCSMIQPSGEKWFYGYLGELGGGIDIDTQTLGAVVRAEDGRGPTTGLTPALLAATGHATLAELLRALSRGGYHVPHAVLRPVLFAAARAGDAAAAAIVRRFGQELALLATNLVRRHHLESEVVTIVASGSLFSRTGPLLFEVFQSEIHAVASQADVLLADRPPALGAARAALAATGVTTQEAWERLRATVGKYVALQRP